MRIFLLVLLGLSLVGCDDDPVDVSNERITGEWQVVAIHNSSPSGPTLGPGNGEIITMIFTQTNALSGTTSVNTFGGEFSIESDTLIIGGLFHTEVADTVFGTAFLSVFNESINPDTDSSEFELSFPDDDHLDLFYQSFKFLSLQKQ